MRRGRGEDIKYSRLAYFAPQDSRRMGSGWRWKVQLRPNFLKKPKEMLVFLKTLPLECDISVCVRFTILVLVGGATPDYGDQSRCRQEAHDPIGSNQPLL
jgi:hypothetical protein